MTKLSVVLPVHNEADIIAETFDEIYKAVRKCEKSVEFILVENGSSDETLKILKSFTKKYKSCRVAVAPKGYGSAVLKGIDVAKGELVSYMPSDGQVDLGVFGRLLNLALKNKWELVKVKRSSRENLGRSLVSIVFALVVMLVFGTKFVDVNGSPRIVGLKNIKKLSLVSKDSFIDAEMLIKASILNWKIKEVAMGNRDRAGGKSTRSIKTFLEFFSNIYKFRTGNTISAWEKKIRSL